MHLEGENGALRGFVGQLRSRIGDLQFDHAHLHTLGGDHSTVVELVPVPCRVLFRAGRDGVRSGGVPLKRIYEMVADEMKKSVLTVTEARWMRRGGALTHKGRERLFGMAPILEGHYRGNSEGGLPEEPAFCLWAIQDSNL